MNKTEEFIAMVRKNFEKQKPSLIKRLLKKNGHIDINSLTDKWDWINLRDKEIIFSYFISLYLTAKTKKDIQLYEFFTNNIIINNDDKKLFNNAFLNILVSSYKINSRTHFAYLVDKSCKILNKIKFNPQIDLNKETDQLLVLLNDLDENEKSAIIKYYKKENLYETYNRAVQTEWRYN